MKSIYTWFHTLLGVGIGLHIASLALGMPSLYTTIIVSVTIVVYAAYTHLDKSHFQAKHIEELAILTQEVKHINDRLGIESVKTKLRTK